METLLCSPEKDGGDVKISDSQILNDSAINITLMPDQFDERKIMAFSILI